VIYALLSALLGIAGSVLTSVYYRNKAKTLEAKLKASDEKRTELAGSLADCVVRHTENAQRYEAVIRGKDMEYLRLQKDLSNALSTDPRAAGVFVRSQLSLSEASDATHPAEYVPDPTSTEGGKGKRGGST
jgi:hypothetical protein